MKNQVALLAEGVDRNGFSSGTSWNGSQVALLAEGVDRNGPSRSGCGQTRKGRPPRGGRG